MTSRACSEGPLFQVSQVVLTCQPRRCRGLLTIWRCPCRSWIDFLAVHRCEQIQRVMNLPGPPWASLLEPFAKMIMAIVYVHVRQWESPWVRFSFCVIGLLMILSVRIWQCTFRVIQLETVHGNPAELSGNAPSGSSQALRKLLAS